MSKVIITLMAVSFLLLLSSSGAASASTTFYGPSFSVSPAMVAPGGTVNIILGTGSNTSSSSYPLCTTAATSCAFDFCPVGNSTTSIPPFKFYSVNELFVTTPTGDVYNLGSSTRALMADQFPDGQTRYTTSGFAPSINITLADSATIPFGPGASVNSTYYWWRTAANGSYVPNTRLDLVPSPVPTVAGNGKYSVNVEGNVVCGSSSTAFVADLYFDIGHLQFGVPEFPLSSLALAVAVPLLVLIGRRQRGVA